LGNSSPASRGTTSFRTLKFSGKLTDSAAALIVCGTKPIRCHESMQASRYISPMSSSDLLNRRILFGKDEKIGTPFIVFSRLHESEAFS
jgi:hypothetical protein